MFHSGTIAKFQDAKHVGLKGPNFHKYFKKSSSCEVREKIDLTDFASFSLKFSRLFFIVYKKMKRATAYLKTKIPNLAVSCCNRGTSISLVIEIREIDLVPDINLRFCSILVSPAELQLLLIFNADRLHRFAN